MSVIDFDLCRPLPAWPCFTLQPLVDVHLQFKTALHIICMGTNTIVFFLKKSI